MATTPWSNVCSTVDSSKWHSVSVHPPRVASWQPCLLANFLNTKPLRAVAPYRRQRVGTRVSSCRSLTPASLVPANHCPSHPWALQSHPRAHDMSQWRTAATVPSSRCPSLGQPASGSHTHLHAHSCSKQTPHNEKLHQPLCYVGTHVRMIHM